MLWSWSAVTVVAALSASAPSPVRVGLMIGEPISVTVGFTLSERFVLQADLGPSTASRLDAVAAADLVYTFPEFFQDKTDGDYFVPWIGLGMRYSAGEDEEPNRFGPRFPFGVSFFTSERAIEFFGSISPGLGLAPDLRATLDGGFGVRLAF